MVKGIIVRERKSRRVVKSLEDKLNIENIYLNLHGKVW